jgi:hypothetical protein
LHQEAILRRILAYHSATDFARDHHFDAIRDTAQFRRNVPVATYEYFEPYLGRVRRGDFRALLADRRMYMFALTSGTTGARKSIPVTEQYLNDSEGTPRSGAALLTGILVCGCGRVMQPSYHANDTTQYGCRRHQAEATAQRCYGLAARVIDGLVAQQVLRALTPAGTNGCHLYDQSFDGLAIHLVQKPSAQHLLTRQTNDHRLRLGLVSYARSSSAC